MRRRKGDIKKSVILIGCASAGWIQRNKDRAGIVSFVSTTVRFSALSVAEFINQSPNSELIQQDFSALSYVQNCMLVTSESLTIHT